MASAPGGQKVGCAVRTTGEMCWGDNTYGRLGDGTAVDRSLPVRVVTTR